MRALTAVRSRGVESIEFVRSARLQCMLSVCYVMCSIRRLSALNSSLSVQLVGGYTVYVPRPNIIHIRIQSAAVTAPSARRLLRAAA